LLDNEDLIIDGNAVYEIDRVCQSEKTEKAGKLKKVKLNNRKNRLNQNTHLFFALFLLAMTRDD
jgi:hypothetical protein